MNRVVALLLAVTACAPQQTPEVPARAESPPPHCPVPPKPPKPLAKIVTTEQLRAWAEATEDARQETVLALKLCTRRLARLAAAPE